MGQAKDRQNRREAKKAKRKLNHKAHVKAKNIEKNKPGEDSGFGPGRTRRRRMGKGAALLAPAIAPKNFFNR